MKVNDRLIWIALRTTGPDPEVDRIASVETVITDKQLEVVVEDPPREVGDDPATVERELLERVQSHVGPSSGLLAGARVQEVRSFLAVHMPELFGYLHYRNIDVATVREIVRRWYPEAHASRPRGDSLRAWIDELRYYRATVFAPTQDEGSEEE